MSMAFVLRGCTFLETIECAAESSICNGVGGRACPNSIGVFLMGTASRTFMYMAPISDSAADEMIKLITCAVVWTAPFVVGEFCVGCHEKCPPALILPFDLLKYEASLWTASTILLAW